MKDARRGHWAVLHSNEMLVTCLRTARVTLLCLATRPLSAEMARLLMVEAARSSAAEPACSKS